jgi:hypothetical protein
VAGGCPRAEGVAPDGWPGSFLRSFMHFSLQIVPTRPLSTLITSQNTLFPATLSPNDEKPPLFPPAALPYGQTSPVAVSGRRCGDCLYHPFWP